MAKDIAVLLREHEQIQKFFLSKGARKALEAIVSASEKLQQALINPIVEDIIPEAWEDAQPKASADDFFDLLDTLPVAIRSRLDAAVPKPEAFAQALCGNLARIAVQRLGVPMVVNTDRPEQAQTAIFIDRVCEAFEFPLKLKRSTIMRYVERER